MVKNNFEIDVKVKCIENGTTQAQIAKDIHTSKEYVNKVIKKQEGIVNRTYVQILRELVARVRAVLNRTMPRTEASDSTMTFGELSIDTASHTVKVSGEEVSLTPKEFDLLVFLASNKGIALSREKILQKVWNYDYFGEDRTVDTHVKMLRGHLGKCRSYIATVWGIGYKFDPDAAR